MLFVSGAYKCIKYCTLTITKTTLLSIKSACPKLHNFPETQIIDFHDYYKKKT